MIRFKEFIQLFEEFRGEGLDGIYKNPSKKELSQAPAWVRGFVMADGDFYIANTSKTTAAIHNYLIKRTGKFYDEINADKLYSDWGKNKFFITVHRVKHTNSFAIGESEVFNQKIDQKRRDLIKKMLKKSRIKNPGVVFLLTGIREFDKPGF